MSILIDRDTKVICQGFTGKNGTFHSEQAIAYGTRMVGGVAPGKGGSHHLNLPVFDTVARSARADRRRGQRRLRAAGRGGRRHLRGDRRRNPADRLHHRGHPGAPTWCGSSARCAGSQSRLVGPNCPGVMTAGECKIGIMPGNIFQQGSVGIVSRSGTLTYEAVYQTTQEGLGQTTAVGIGGDPVKGTEFIEVLDLFLSDPETASIVMIGEIGGSAEEDAARVPGAGGQAGPEEADGRLHRRAHRAAWPPHGPCGRDHLGRQGRRRGQDRRHGGGRHPRLALASARSARRSSNC